MTALPDRHGFFGQFGGKFVPETLMAALDELESAYRKLKRDRDVPRELDDVLADFVGRPTPLTERAEIRGALRRLHGSSSSAKTSTTPARTRSTTPSARR